LEDSLGAVQALFISKKGDSSRLIQDKIYLDEKGVLGDKFYGKDRDRSVLLSTEESYEIAQNKNIIMSYGALGENILLDYNPYHLTIGDRLKIGIVILEITQNCTICNHLSIIDKKLPKLLKNDRGIFVKVVKSGSIFLNDKVYLV